MQYTIDLPPALEQWLARLARSRGGDMPATIVHVLDVLVREETAKDRRDAEQERARRKPPLSAVEEAAALAAWEKANHATAAERRARAEEWLRPITEATKRARMDPTPLPPWDGDETTEELLAMEKELDDEDAGRWPAK